jgi:enoyl-CoA hydratase/carnithine racemase
MNLLISESENVITLQLNRIESRNAISVDLLNQLIEALEKIRKTNYRALLIRSSDDKIFCSGADLKERANMSEKEVFQFLDRLRYSFQLLESIPFPTISYLNGSAFGGGLELALCTDFRFAKEHIELGLTETKLGIIPGAGGTQRLTRLIGESLSKELIFTAKRINASKAKEYGIINSIFTEDELQHFIQELLSSAPLAILSAKESIQKGKFLPLEQALDIEREEYLKTLYTKDRNEALAAFKEKRKPIFKGE